MKRFVALVMVFSIMMYSLAFLSSISASAETEDDLVQRFVNIALAEEGYCEYGDNGNKYGESFGANYLAWCGYFVMWCGQQAGVYGDRIKYLAYIPNVSSTYGDRYHLKSSGYTPEKGDLVIYDKDGNGNPDHIGIIYDVADGKIYTIEGNLSNKVKKDWWYINGSNSVKGYVQFRTGNVEIHLYCRQLSKGSTGNDVFELQSYLLDLGYNLGSYGADGDFGSATENAVKQFQRDHGLTADGVFGPASWGVLEEIIRGPQVAQPGKPVLSVSTSDELHETTLNWNATSDTNWYDIRIYDASGNETIWGKAYHGYTAFAALLPAGSYQADIASVNENGNYTFGDRVSFSVASASVSGMGELKGKTVYNDHTYEVYRKDTTWLAAKRLAEQAGGYLVTITSQGEQDAVKLLSDKNDGREWIGAESYTNHSMRWVTGEEWSYSNWATGEPNNSGGIEQCAHLYADGTWNDVNNDSTDDMHGYIVEYNTVWGEEMSTGYDRVLPDVDYLIAAAGTSDKSTFYYLDIEGTAQPASNETNVSLCGPSSGDVQPYDIWTIRYDSSTKFYTIKQKGTNMALDVYTRSTASGTNVQAYESHDGVSQQWAISYNSSNGYRIQARCSGMSLDIQSGNISNGTNVSQWPGNNTAAQSWLFIPYQPAQTLPEGK